MRSWPPYVTRAANGFLHRRRRGCGFLHLDTDSYTSAPKFSFPPATCSDGVTKAPACHPMATCASATGARAGIHGSPRVGLRELCLEHGVGSDQRLDGREHVAAARTGAGRISGLVSFPKEPPEAVLA